MKISRVSQKAKAGKTKWVEEMKISPTMYTIRATCRSRHVIVSRTIGAYWRTGCDAVVDHRRLDLPTDSPELSYTVHSLLRSDAPAGLPPISLTRTLDSRRFINIYP